MNTCNERIKKTSSLFENFLVFLGVKINLHFTRKVLNVKDSRLILITAASEWLHRWPRLRHVRGKRRWPRFRRSRRTWLESNLLPGPSTHPRRKSWTHKTLQRSRSPSTKERRVQNPPAYFNTGTAPRSHSNTGTKSGSHTDYQGSLNPCWKVGTLSRS